MSGKSMLVWFVVIVLAIFAFKRFGSSAGGAA